MVERGTIKLIQIIPNDENEDRERNLFTLKTTTNG